MPNRMAVLTGVSVVVAGLALSGCGSDSPAKTTSSSSSTTSSKPSKSATTASPTTPAHAAAPTIADYLKANGITETAMHHGDPGPAIDLPVPEGWTQIPEGPDAPYGGIGYDAAANPKDPPTVVAIFSKLTGDVDAAQILELAPNEVQNLAGYTPLAEPSQTELSGFKAVQLGGNYQRDGQQRVVAQKTVIIPGEDGLYVLQLNADGPNDDVDALMSVTKVIDDQTTITP